jgi:hypothetical protein
MCVDSTEVLPLVELRTETFIVGQTTFKVASSKIVKHEKTCSDNQHIFIQFAFVTFRFLTPKVVSLLQKIQKIMNNNVVLCPLEL